MRAARAASGASAASATDKAGAADKTDAAGAGAVTMVSVGAGGVRTEDG
jgi:hypothetical protein